MPSEQVSQQLSLPVQLDDSATLDNFYLPENSLNLLLLAALRDTKSVANLYLWGEKGAGISHLLQGLCHQANQHEKSAIYVPLQDVADHSAAEVVDGLESLQLVCLDNLDAVATNADWCEQLFHLFNRSEQTQCRLVFGSTSSPTNLDSSLQDLQSRLSLSLIFRVVGLSDDDKTEALIFRARRRGMDLPDSVAQYLIRRHSRAPDDLFRALDYLDRATLSAKRTLTVPFVKTVLEGV